MIGGTLPLTFFQATNKEHDLHFRSTFFSPAMETGGETLSASDVLSSFRYLWNSDWPFSYSTLATKDDCDEG